MNGSRNGRLEDLKPVGEVFFGGVLTQVEQGNFQRLVQAEDSWSGIRFVPGEMLVQGCGEGCELLVC